LTKRKRFGRVASVNRFRFRQHRGVIPGLLGLRREFPAQADSINDMILYALDGRDRRRLDLDFVERTRKHCEEMERLFPSLRRTPTE
jgi:hypothetical protein